MFFDSVAAIPATEPPAHFIHEVDAVSAMPLIEGHGRVESISEEDAFRRVFEYFFAGIINRAMGVADESPLEDSSLASDYMSRLYSQEIAQSLIADVNFKNLIAVRSFTYDS